MEEKIRILNDGGKVCCFECGEDRDEFIQYHHIIPRSKGGKKSISVCSKCHQIIHNYSNPKNIDISTLTKEGLKSAKEKGVILGNPRWKECIGKAHQKRRAKGKETAKRYMPVIQEIIDSGITSYNGIAREMNRRGIKSPRGRNVSPSLVRKIIIRRKNGTKD